VLFPLSSICVLKLCVFFSCVVDDEKMQLKSSEQVKETEAVRIRKQEEKRLSIVSDLVIKKVWF
jgi:hypothetical protein